MPKASGRRPEAQRHQSLPLRQLELRRITEIFRL